MKKALTLILALAMLLSFAACSTKEKDSDDKASANPSQNPTDQTGGDEDLVEIEFWFANLGTDVTNVQGVENGINAITEEAIGVHVNLRTTNVSDYGTQLSLAISNNETVDIATFTPMLANSWITLFSNGAIMDMSGLVETHGQDIKNLFGEDLLAATKVGDGLYGIVNYKMLNSNSYFCYRTDVLEECGVYDTLVNATTWAEFETVLAAIRDNAGMYAIGGNQGQAVASANVSYGTSGYIGDAKRWDALNDTLNLVWTDQNGNVGNRYEVEEFIAGLEMVADWYEKGYVYADSAITQDQTESLVMSNAVAGFITNGEYGVSTDKSQSCGNDMTCVEFATGMVTGDSALLFGMFIPSSAAEPEAAMKFLNLLYTNADLMNLVIWGVEGENYTVSDDGMADYPEGTDISNCGYHLLHFQMGNQFLLHPWAGSEGGATYRDDSLENFLSAERSIYLGLSVDTSNDTLISALTQVNNEYVHSLLNGLYSETMLNDFMTKLDSAGIEEYLSLYRTAVDEFMA